METVVTQDPAACISKQPYTMRFRSSTVKEGDKVVKREAHKPVTFTLPFVTEAAVEALFLSADADEGAGAQQRTFIVNLVNDAMITAAREQVQAYLESIAEVSSDVNSEIPASVISEEALSLAALAEAAESNNGRGIPKEMWEAFKVAYIEAQRLTVDAETEIADELAAVEKYNNRIAVQADVFARRLEPVRNNNDLINLLAGNGVSEEFAAASNREPTDISVLQQFVTTYPLIADEYADIITFLFDKAKRMLATVPKSALDDLL